VRAMLEVADVCGVLQGERPIPAGKPMQRLIDQLEHGQNGCLDRQAMGSGDPVSRRRATRGCGARLGRDG
jgi:hypothetical protein